MIEALIECIYVMLFIVAMLGLGAAADRLSDLRQRNSKPCNVAKIEGKPWDMAVLKHYCDDMRKVKDLSKQHVVIKGVFAQKN